MRLEGMSEPVDLHDDDAVVGRPLTRRELRLREAREAAAGTPAPLAPVPPVPPVLPPEPPVDDVRWDAPLTEAVGAPGGATAGASDDDTQALEPVVAPDAEGAPASDAAGHAEPDAAPADTEPDVAPPDGEPDAAPPDAEPDVAPPDAAAPAPAPRPGVPLRVSALGAPPPEPDAAVGAPSWFPVSAQAPRPWRRDEPTPGASTAAGPDDGATPDADVPDDAVPDDAVPDDGARAYVSRGDADPAGPAPSADAAASSPDAAAPSPDATAPRPPARSPAPGGPLPTLTDLLAARPAPPEGPAERGWQGVVRRITGGRISPRPGPAEQAHRATVATVQRGLDGPRTVVVINPKGGAHKTTATLLLAATFGQHRGGYTLAWDNNETRGTLGWRSRQARHHNTAVNLLQDLDRFADAGSARVGDLDGYVRSQGPAQFDVLASDEDAASAASIDAEAFRSLHRTLQRFYRVMVVDTGNNMRASNWQAAIEAADQVVIVSTIREDTAQSAAWAVDALRATGHEDAVRRAVTVLSAPAPQRDDALAARLHAHFGALTRVVLDVPYDPSLVGGSPLDLDALARPTREAWLRVSAAVAEGL